jgi:DNA-binding response OmpR family regulator
MDCEVKTVAHGWDDGGDSMAGPPPPVRILVVDDDDLLRQFLREVLVAGGYPLVDLAADAREALALLKDNVYQVVLADVNMPGMNGFELLDHLHAYYGAIAVLMITGMPELENAVLAVKKGACDYLAKPILPQKLLDAVSGALQRQRERETMAHAPAMPSSRLARDYRVIRNLGSGSMGIVLLVEKDGRNYAMKLLRQDGQGAHLDTRRQRFLREGQLLTRIDHPCIVKIYEHGIPDEGEDGSPYIIMEFVPGHSLNQLIERRTLSMDDRVAILSQLASALDAVHRHDVMHRDVKPANVLVTKEMHAKLTDFGVARIDDSALTMTAEMIGSPAYMAPECFESHRTETDGRADIFSLGILGYEMFTGFRPFSGRAFTDLAQAIRASRPVAPRTLVPEVPEGIEAILARMLEKSPEDRFQRAGEIVVAINQMKAGAVMRALKTDISPRSLLRALRPRRRVWQ